MTLTDKYFNGLKKIIRKYIQEILNKLVYSVHLMYTTYYYFRK